MIDTSFPPIRLDDADALLRECMRLEADVADLEEGPVSEWLKVQMIARAVLLECATIT